MKRTTKFISELIINFANVLQRHLMHSATAWCTVFYSSFIRLVRVLGNGHQGFYYFSKIESGFLYSNLGPAEIWSLTWLCKVAFISTSWYVLHVLPMVMGNWSEHKGVSLYTLIISLKIFGVKGTSVFIYMFCMWD